MKRDREETMADQDDESAAVSPQEALQEAAFDCMDYVSDLGRDMMVTAQAHTLHVALCSLPASTARMYNLQPDSDIRFQLCFGEDCLKDNEPPVVYAVFNGASGEECRACARSTHLLNTSKMHHTKALLTSINNDLDILWPATRPAPAAGAAAAGAAASGAAGAAGDLGAMLHEFRMGLIKERVLERFGVAKESYQDDLFAVNAAVNQLHVDKEALAQQIIDHTLAVTSPPARRLRNNLVVRLVQLLAYNVQQLPARCFMCGSPHAHEMDYPQSCTNSLCRYKLCNSSLFTDVLSAVQQRPDVVSLLVQLGRSASYSHNSADVLKPVPVDFMQGDAGKEVQWDQLRTTLTLIPSVADMAACQTEAELKLLLQEVQANQTMREDPDAPGVPSDKIYHLLWWLVSNISDHITPCSRQEVEQHVQATMASQAAALPTSSCAYFRVHSLSLAHSEAHRQLAQAQGCIRAWHGSKVPNWYSILKHGLRSMSGTRMQLNGQAYGAGIYLSCNYSTSAGYSGAYYNSLQHAKAKGTLPAAAAPVAGAAASNNAPGAAAGVGAGAAASTAAAAGGDVGGKGASGSAAAAAAAKAAEPFKMERQLPDSSSLSSVVALCQVVVDDRIRPDNYGSSSSSGLRFNASSGSGPLAWRFGGGPLFGSNVPTPTLNMHAPQAPGAAPAAAAAAGAAPPAAAAAAASAAAAPFAAAGAAAGAGAGAPILLWGAAAPASGSSAGAAGSSSPEVARGLRPSEWHKAAQLQNSNILVAQVPELVCITHLIVH